MNFREKLSTDQLNLLFHTLRSHTLGTVYRKAYSIILLHEKSSSEKIYQSTGYSRSSALKFKKSFIKEGLSALIPFENKHRSGSVLSRNQKKELLVILDTQTPDNIWSNGPAFWTADLVAKLIYEKFNVEYKSKDSISILLKESSLTLLKPKKVSVQRDEIDNWHRDIKPIILKEIANPENVVLVSDEVILTSATRTEKIWVKKDTKAVIKDVLKKEFVHINGFLNVLTGELNAFKLKEQTSKEIIQTLEKLIQIYPDKRIVIVWDNLGHKSEEIKDFLIKTNGKFQLYNFPSYVPEINTIKQVWKEMESNIFSDILIPKLELKTKEALEFLHSRIFKYNFIGIHSLL